MNLQWPFSWLSFVGLQPYLWIRNTQIFTMAMSFILGSHLCLSLYLPAFYWKGRKWAGMPVIYLCASQSHTHHRSPLELMMVMNDNLAVSFDQRQHWDFGSCSSTFAWFSKRYSYWSRIWPRSPAETTANTLCQRAWARNTRHRPSMHYSFQRFRQFASPTVYLVSFWQHWSSHS